MQHADFLIAAPRTPAPRREPVLAKWGRELRPFIYFPVTFRSGLDRGQFMIMSSLTLFYAIAPGIVDPEGLYANAFFYVKYLFSMLLISYFVLLALARQRINLSPMFPVAALLLSVAGGLSFTYSSAVAPGTTTFATALIPLLVAAIPLVIPTDATRTDGAAVAKYLFGIVGAASFFRVLWQMTNYASGEGDLLGTQSFAIAPVSFVVLSGLFRRNLLLILSLALIGLSVILRPGSTLGFSTIFAIAVIVLCRLRFRRLFRLGCALFAGTIIAGNLAILMSDDVARTVYSIEPVMKEDVLESRSSNEFRLGIISAVRDDMAEGSLLVGKFFSGGINVDARKYYWLKDDSVPIHSDYIIILQQGGLIGYGLFASFLIGVARLCATGARLAHATGDGRSETLFDALQAINIIFMLYNTANPMMQFTESTLPYVMLVALTIFLARAQPGFAGPSRQSAAISRGRRMSLRTR